jgi:hypothetical protein
MAQIHVRRGDRVVDGAQRRPTPVKHGLTLLAPQQMGSICCSDTSAHVPLENAVQRKRRKLARFLTEAQRLFRSGGEPMTIRDIADSKHSPTA